MRGWGHACKFNGNLAPAGIEVGSSKSTITTMITIHSQLCMPFCRSLVSQVGVSLARLDRLMQRNRLLQSSYLERRWH